MLSLYLCPSIACSPLVIVLPAAFYFEVSVSQICFYLDFNLDDSYTAKKVSIRSGTSSHDLIDVTAIEPNESVGTSDLWGGAGVIVELLL